VLHGTTPHPIPPPQVGRESTWLPFVNLTPVGATLVIAPTLASGNTTPATVSTVASTANLNRPLRPAGNRATTRVAPTHHTSLTFFSGRLRTGLPVAAWIALRTAGDTTAMVGSPTPPQKS